MIYNRISYKKKNLKLWNNVKFKIMCPKYIKFNKALKMNQ